MGWSMHTAQLEHRTAAEYAPDLDLGRMFNAGDGWDVCVTGSQHKAALTVQRTIQRE